MHSDVESSLEGTHTSLHARLQAIRFRFCVRIYFQKESIKGLVRYTVQQGNANITRAYALVSDDSQQLFFHRIFSRSSS